MSRLRTTLISAAVASAAVLAMAAPASAHTEAEARSGASGITDVTLTITHGCDGKPTDAMRVQLPAGSRSVTAQNPDGWTSTVTGTEIDWSGPGLSPDQHHEFSFSIGLTGAAGSTVTFPTIQKCPDGAEIAWIQETVPGQAEPEHPTPAIVIPVGGSIVADSSTTVAAAATSGGPSTTARMALDANAITNEGSEQSTSGRIVFFGVMIVIFGGAGILFLKYRKRAPKV